jgi:predicted ABC-type exoprotein transport system permease subunit
MMMIVLGVGICWYLLSIKKIQLNDNVNLKILQQLIIILIIVSTPRLTN